MSDAETGVLTVWDSPSEVTCEGSVVLWNGHDETCGRISVLSRLEARRDHYRSECLDWYRGIADLEVGGTRVVDHLNIEPGLSYWWMTLPAELNYVKSRAFLDVLRLMVLEDVLLEQPPARLYLVASDERLAEAVSGLCRHLGVAFQWSRSAVPVQRGHVSRRLVGTCPRGVRALVLLIRWLPRVWPLRRASRVGWSGDPDAVFFCTYNLAASGEEPMEFRAYSRYWGGLPDLLAASGRPTNWLHIFHSRADRTSRGALDQADSRNSRGDLGEFHAFVHSWLSLSILLSVLWSWIRLRRAAAGLGDLSCAIASQDRPWLWSLLEGDWKESIYGRTAISNLLDVELFDRVLADVPNQERGIFLFENQPWERAFVHAWCKHGHGQLIAVAHAMVRYWDLRYFLDPLVGEVHSGPHPPQVVVALNGPVAVSTFLAAGVSPSGIIEVEALRFDHLNSSERPTGNSADPDDPLRLLVLGDLDPVSTRSTFDLLDAAVHRASLTVSVGLRPHPNYSIDLQDYPELDIRMISGSVTEECHDFDAVLSGNWTSAAVEGLVAGIPVIVQVDDTGLNFSPLYGVDGVDFVASDLELVSSLENLGSEGRDSPRATSFFFLDESLPRWHRALGLPSAQAGNG